MSSAPKILLVSPDLMISSRVAALAQASGCSVEAMRSPEAKPPGTNYDLVLLDLQCMPAEAADIVAKTHAMIAQLGRAAAAPAVRVVAFGPHVAKQRLDDAKAAGADAVVSRGELLGSFPAILRLWFQPT